MLQGILGFDRYLSIFARYKIKSLKVDRNEKDFFVFLDLLPDTGLVLDIGANLGIMTWHLLHGLKKAKVWAFEPIPDNLRVLKKVLSPEKQPRLKIFGLALGAEAGKTTMVLPEVDDVLMQGLSHVVHESIEEFNDGREYEVEIDTLDNLIKSDNPVSGIKLDVENFEYFVLKGGEEMLRRDKPVVYTELWENENRRRCMDFMEELGYEVKVFTKGELVPFASDSYGGQNFFFIPKI